MMLSSQPKASEMSESPEKIDKNRAYSTSLSKIWKRRRSSALQKFSNVQYAYGPGGGAAAAAAAAFASSSKVPRVCFVCFCFFVCDVYDMCVCTYVCVCVYIYIYIYICTPLTRALLGPRRRIGSKLPKKLPARNSSRVPPHPVHTHTHTRTQ